MAQETFTKVFKNLNYYDCERGDFYNFVLSNSKQVIADYYKVRIPRKEKVEEVELDEKIRFDLDLDIESELDLTSIINSLPEEQRSAFKLIYVKKLSYKDAARVMNKSESSVKSLAFRARRTLRKEITRKNPEIGRRYGFKEALKIFVISAICIGIVGGFAYAMIRLYRESVKKDTYTLNEVFNDVPDKNSTITRDNAVIKINEYLKILGIEDTVEADELHLIRDYELLEECWKVENENYILEIDSEKGKIFAFSVYDISKVNNNANEVLDKLELVKDYELYDENQTGDFTVFEYAKKYGEVYNLYQKVTVMVKENKIITIWKVDYEYEDKEVKVSKDEAIRIAEENGIEVESVELVIERIVLDSSDYYSKTINNIDEYNNLMDLENSIIIKLWSIKANSDLFYYVDSNTGELLMNNLLDEEIGSN